MTKVKGRKTARERPVPAAAHFLTGFLAGGAVLAAMLMLSALAMSSLGLPSGAGELLMLISAAAGSLIAGLVTAARCGQKYLLCGLAAGALLYTAVLLCGVMTLSRMPDLSDLGRAAVYLTAAMTGGVLGVRKDGRQRR